MSEKQKGPELQSQVETIKDNEQKGPVKSLPQLLGEITKDGLIDSKDNADLKKLLEVYDEVTGPRKEFLKESLSKTLDNGITIENKEFYDNIIGLLDKNGLLIAKFSSRYEDILYSLEVEGIEPPFSIRKIPGEEIGVFNKEGKIIEKFSSNSRLKTYGGGDKVLGKYDDNGNDNNKIAEYTELSKKPEKSVDWVDIHKDEKLVSEIQKKLNEKLELTGNEILELDGKLGPKTLKKIRVFQDKEGLNVDGIIGPETFNKLFNKSLLEYMEKDS